MKVINVLNNHYFISVQYLTFYPHEVKDLLYDVPDKDKEFIRPFYGVNQVVPETPSASNANYIESNDLPTYPTDSAFSVELLFSQYTPPSDDDMAHIFSYGYISGGVFRGIYVYGLANNRFKIEVTNGSESVEYEGIIYDDELPDVFRLAFSFQPDNIFIYYNDLSYNTKVTSIDTVNGITLPLNAGNPTLLIGGLGTNLKSNRNISPFTDTGNTHATFTINELRIWQSARDVTELNNNFLTINDNSDLFLHYAINEGRGNTLNNTGNVLNDGEQITDYNATIQNSTTDDIQWDIGTPFLVVTIDDNNQIVTWMSGGDYSVNTIVEYDGILYYNTVIKTNTDTDNPSVDDDWMIISGVNETVVRTLIANWAEEGNNDQIPANKLMNAPSGAVSTWESGTSYPVNTIVEYDNILYYTTVEKTISNTDNPTIDSDWILIGNADELIIRNIVANWAETDNDDPIPASKLMNAPSGPVISWMSGNVYPVNTIVEYDGILYYNTIAKTAFNTNNPSIDDDWISISGINATDASIREVVFDWAEEGNTDPIPMSKLINATGGAVSIWMSGNVYPVNTIIAYNNNLYYNNVAKTAFNTDPPTIDNNWILLSNLSEVAIRELISDWAEQGNTDPIPESKLTNASSVARTVVSDWAEEGNSDAIPVSKLNNARSLMADWAEQGNSSAIPTSKLSNVPTISDWAEEGNSSDIPVTKLTNTRSLMADWAESDNDDPIPKSKLTNTRSLIANWAEQDNTTTIPVSKLSNARSLIVDWAEEGNNSDIPSSKLTNASSVARTVISDWAEIDNDDAIPVAKLINASGGAVSTWMSGNIYPVNTIVAYDNDLYYNNLAKGAFNTNPPTVDNNWILLSNLNEGAVRELIEDWAEQSNTDAIPESKLTNTPSVPVPTWVANTAYSINNIREHNEILYYNTVAKTTSDSMNPSIDNDWVAIGGINETEVRNLIANWAEIDNSDQIPANKLMNAPNGAIPTWESGTSYPVNTIIAYNNNLYYNNVAKTAFNTDPPTIDNNWILLSDLSEVTVRELISDWAEEGNTDPIPESKLTNASSVARTVVSDWAEEGNSDAIPVSKLNNARSLMADLG